MATATKSMPDHKPGASEGASVSAHVLDIYRILANNMVRDLDYSLRLVNEELEKRNIDYMIISDRRGLRLLKDFLKTKGISRNSYFFSRGSRKRFSFSL